ncbi:MAG: DUF1461 domain-containing protein [bacterium]|nr:DUF1461 domain-containing protein [bacterium]
MKRIVLGISLLYFTLYIPTAFMSYSPLWYMFNNKIHSRVRLIGYDKAQQYTGQLTNFFLHGDHLPDHWTAKERKHLADVRNILDYLALFALLSTISIIATYNRKTIASSAGINVAIILSLLLLLPFFAAFWVNVFHPFLFDNNLWRNNYLDHSFYIMPRVFFKYSMIFLISTASLLNTTLWFFLKKEDQKPTGR